MSRALEDLKIALKKLEIEPKKSLGQNFLISDHVINKIVKAAEDLEPETIIEVGPGLGALTNLLKEKNKLYHLIELDRKFAGYWRDLGFSVIEGDALKINWQEIPKKGKSILVSNLPYQISSSMVIDRSLDQKPLDAMILMFQKEVAQRIRAKFNSEDYSLLSVIAQTCWDIETLLEVGPRDFLPPPNVASRVLIFHLKKTQLKNKKQFLKFAKACFLHRRKLLLSNLKEGLGKKEDFLREGFAKVQIKDKARAQELSLQQFVDLFTVLGYEDKQ